ESDRVIGATIQDTLTKQKYEIKAKITINATGPWAQQVLEDNYFTTQKQLLLSKGIHIIFPAEKLPITGAIALKSSDNREGYAIRRKQCLFVVTTDVPDDGKLASPTAAEEAITSLLHMTQNCLAESVLERDDIIGTWAGMSPLIMEEGKSARDTS